MGNSALKNLTPQEKVIFTKIKGQIDKGTDYKKLYKARKKSGPSFPEGKETGEFNLSIINAVSQELKTSITKKNLKVEEK